MKSIAREQAAVAIAEDGVEFRVESIGGGMSIAFVELPGGADLREATTGLPDNLCQCPHWGYVLEGRVRMHTRDGHEDFGAGDSFYWAPGHAPEALEDAKYLDFSPTDELNHVLAHVRGEA